MDIVINQHQQHLPLDCQVIPHQGHYYHQLLACLNYPANAPPVADLLRQCHGLEGQWVVATPIHWQATHNDAMILLSGEGLQLSLTKAQQWFEAFSGFMAGEQLEVHYHDAVTWLVRCDNLPALTAHPVHLLHHQSLMPALQQLDTSLYWQRLITASQMFFSAHPLNQSGLSAHAINGVWFWGGGALHKPATRPLICADESMLSWARLLSTQATVQKPSVSQAGKSLWLFNELESQACEVLQTQFKRHRLRWYWNNIAYTTSKSWWSSLKERLF